MKIYLTLFVLTAMAAVIGLQTATAMKWTAVHKENPAGMENTSRQNIFVSQNAGSVGALDRVAYFPPQNPNTNNREACPIVLNNGQILIAWLGQQDSILCSVSTDTGSTWEEPIQIKVYPWGTDISDIAGIQTNTGRIIIICRSWRGIHTLYSDNNGLDWLEGGIVPETSAYDLSISQLMNDNIFLVYYSNEAGSIDLFYRVSMDDGITWGDEQILAAESGAQFSGSVISVNDSMIMAVYSEYTNDHNALHKRTSINNGLSWSSSQKILDNTYPQINPNLLRNTDGKLWITFETYETVPPYLHDVLFIYSLDGGDTWSLPENFSKYTGQDQYHNSSLLDGLPFIAFSSDRGDFLNHYLIWYGIVGIAPDINPPPALVGTSFYTPVPGRLLPVRAVAKDESVVESVQLSYSVNGSPAGIVELYNDGFHDDFEPHDAYWSAGIGPFDNGDRIETTYTLTDDSSNTVQKKGTSFTVNETAILDTGNISLAIFPNSALGTQGESFGSSLAWPAHNGHDFLSFGGFWVGVEVAGEKRVMNCDYFENDWTALAGTSIMLSPGLSDLDADLKYDDQNAVSTSIGLQIHQKSFQWSEDTRKDMLVFTYTISNTGQSGNLNNVYAALWLDPDFSEQTDVTDDLGAYDVQKEIAYLYDSQSRPSGMLGIKMLGESPMTINFYTYPSDAQKDTSRFERLTAGIFPIPGALPGDYRILIGSYPFSLAVGDSHVVSFGIIMGNDLSDLRSKADTLEYLYGKTTSFMLKNNRDIVPQDFELAQNYPNPFNSSTLIGYYLPVKSHVNIKIFDISGRLVDIIEDRNQTPGRHTARWNPNTVGSGVYFYRIQFENGKSLIKKCLLIK